MCVRLYGSDRLFSDFNAKKVLCVSGTKFVVGPVMIVKGTARGLEFLNEEEVEEAKAEFY